MSTISEALKKAQKKRITNDSNAVTFLKDSFFNPPQKMHRFGKKQTATKKHNPFLIFLLILAIGITSLSFFFLNYVNRTVGSPLTRMPSRTILTAPAYPKKPLTELSIKPVPETMIEVEVEKEVFPEISLPSLQGIMYSETSPHAVIDGSIYKENDNVKEFTLKKIFPDKIVLEANNEETYLFLN